MSRPLAVVTGTSSGIGKAITTSLLTSGWSVVGVCRNTPDFESSSYTHLTCDLSKPDEVADCTKIISDTYKDTTLLINNAGVGHFGPHETLSPKTLQEMTQVNLLAPLILTQGLLRLLRENQGRIIAISSFSAEEASSFGAAYAATKAGLSHFYESLFEETRKHGLQVTTITPDITRTPFYSDAPFAPSDNKHAALTPECVAQAVQNVLAMRDGTVTTKVVLRPQRILLDKRPMTPR